MMLSVQVALVVGFYMLASVVSASAECTWLLWTRLEITEGRKRGSGHWEHDSDAVYTNHAQCWQRIRQHTGISERGSLRDWYDWMRGAGRYRDIQKALST